MGNTANQDTPYVAAFGSSMLPKGIVFFFVLSVATCLPKYYVEMCCTDFILYKSFFTPLLLGLLMPMSESVVRSTYIQFWYPAVAGGVACIILLLWALAAKQFRVRARVLGHRLAVTHAPSPRCRAEPLGAVRAAHPARARHCGPVLRART